MKKLLLILVIFSSCNSEKDKLDREVYQQELRESYFLMGFNSGYLHGTIDQCDRSRQRFTLTYEELKFSSNQKAAFYIKQLKR
jgi:hypothetical protein